MSIYQRIDGSGWRNIWAVGDLHGCHRLLINRLDQFGFDPSCDLLISVGDLVDRGDENVECLDLLNMPWFRAVRGNHEQMAIDALAPHGNIAHWMCNGGGWFFSLDDEQGARVRSLITQADQMPLIIELMSAGKKVVIAHADYPAMAYEYGKPLDPVQVIWGRERISLAMGGRGGPIDGADLFIFGHTPLQRPFSFHNLRYIDTGAVFGGKLTLLQLQGKPT